MSMCPKGERLSDEWLMRGFETDSSAWGAHYMECDTCFEYMVDILKYEPVTRNALVRARLELRAESVYV